MTYNSQTQIERGGQFEELARKHIEKTGLTHVCSNYRCKSGEIDLIFLDNRSGTLVFVEVKYRSSNNHGHPLEFIHRKKQQRLKLAAATYLIKNPHYQHLICRFDAFAVLGKDPKSKLEISWVKNAFD